MFFLNPPNIVGQKDAIMLNLALKFGRIVNNSYLCAIILKNNKKGYEESAIVTYYGNVADSGKFAGICRWL